MGRTAIRLAWKNISFLLTWRRGQTYIFDVWTWVYSDDVAVLDSQIVANHPVDAGRTIVEVIISQHNQDSVLPLLALD
jgi:hypothetical protein